MTSPLPPQQISDEAETWVFTLSRRSPELAEGAKSDSNPQQRSIWKPPGLHPAFTPFVGLNIFKGFSTATLGDAHIEFFYVRVILHFI